MSFNAAQFNAVYGKLVDAWLDYADDIDARIDDQFFGKQGSIDIRDSIEADVLGLPDVVLPVLQGSDAGEKSRLPAFVSNYIAIILGKEANLSQKVDALDSPLRFVMRDAAHNVQTWVSIAVKDSAEFVGRNIVAPIAEGSPVLFVAAALAGAAYIANALGRGRR